MAALPHLARAVVLLRDATRGEIELGRGGALRLRYGPVPEDLARLREGIASIARAYLAAGAEEVYLPVEGLAPVRRESDLASLAAAPLAARDLSLLYAVHLFGGAGMAADPARGSCDGEGRSFSARGVFVADASALPGNTGVNPQITIMAHALRVADAIAAEAGRQA
jgi:choline dehydrogenase-like flavoprotein